MSEKKVKKGSLPHGWVVKQSSTYKDRVYYFNQNTGVSTWELPTKLDEAKDTKMKKIKEKDKADGKGNVLKERTEKIKTEKVEGRGKGDPKCKIESKVAVTAETDSERKVEGKDKVDQEGHVESKGEKVAVKRKAEPKDKTDSKGKEVIRAKVDLTAKTESKGKEVTRAKVDQTAKTESKGKEETRAKVDQTAKTDSKGKEETRAKVDQTAKTESKGKEETRAKVDQTAKTDSKEEERKVKVTGSDLEEGEVVDSEDEPGTNNTADQPSDVSDTTGTATNSQQQSDIEGSGSKRKETIDSSDSESSAESPSKRSRHAHRRHKHKKYRSKKSSKNELSPHRKDKTSSDAGRKRRSDAVEDKDSSEMKVHSARELGLKPLKLDKPLRRPRTSSVGSVGPALAPKKASASVDRKKGRETSLGNSKEYMSPLGLGAECRKSCSKWSVSGKGLNEKNEISKNSGSDTSKSETVTKCESVENNKSLLTESEKPRDLSSADVGKAIERLNKAIEKTVKKSLKRSADGDLDDLKSSKSLKTPPKAETVKIGTEKLTKNQRKKRAKAARKTANLAKNLEFVNMQIQKVTDSPEEKRKLDALRKSQSTETLEIPNAIVQDRPVLQAVRRLHVFGQTVKHDQVQNKSAVNTAGPLGPILDSMRPPPLPVNTTKPAAATTAGVNRQNRPTGSKLVQTQTAVAPPVQGLADATALDTRLSFQITPQPQREIQQIDFNLFNAQHAQKKVVPVQKSDRLFGRQSPDLPLDNNNALYNPLQKVGPSYIGTGEDRLSGKGGSAAPWGSQAEFNFNNSASNSQNMSVEHKVVQSEALKTIEKSGGLFGKGSTKNLFGKQGNGVAKTRASGVARTDLDIGNRNVSTVLNLEPSLPGFGSGTSSLSSPEAMQQDAFFSPIHRSVTPELTMESAQSWQNMDTTMHQNQLFHTPHTTGHLRSAATDPLPLRSNMNISSFEAALGIGNQTYSEDVIESMDVDQGSSADMTPRINNRLTKVQLRGLSDAVTEDQKLFIVLDTNVLMQHTSYIEDLRDRNFSNLGKPVVIIPWIVMQELDSLKDNKGPNRDRQISYSAQTQARLAVKFLHACFQSKHPRIVGQTPHEAAHPTSENLTIESNDDQVLQCCLQCKEKYPDALVVLFTNDMNLCSKAIIMGIQAFTHENLQNGINNFCVVPADVDDDSIHLFHPQTPTLVDPAQKKKEDVKKLADNVLCDLKEILHEGLSIVLKSELQAAYDDVWKDIVFKKPPWTLSDILQSISKHWIAVFGDLFGRDLECHIQVLTQQFKSGQGFGIGIKEVCGLIYNGIALYQVALKFKSHNVPQTFDRFLKNMHTLRKICQGVLREKLPVDVGLTQLKEMVLNPTSAISHNQAATSQDLVSAETSVISPSMPDIVMLPGGERQPVAVFNLRQKDVEDVQSKFQQLWENINHFCDLLMQVFQVPNGASIPPDLPSRDQAVTFFARLLPCIEQLRTSYRNMIMSPPELLEAHPQVFLKLCENVNLFFVKLDVQVRGITSPPLEPSQLEYFYSNDEKREVLQCGYSQLEEMMNRLEFCDTQLNPEERLIIHSS